MHVVKWHLLIAHAEELAAVSRFFPVCGGQRYGPVTRQISVRFLLGRGHQGQTETDRQE